MENVFDQFDAKEPNPFDKFDGPKNILDRTEIRDLSEATKEKPQSVKNKLDKAEFYSEKSGEPLNNAYQVSDKLPDIGPIYFDTNAYVDKEIANRGDVPAKKEELNSVLSTIAQPFISQGYVAASALNRGVAVFSEHIGLVQDFIQESIGNKPLDYTIWDRAADIYSDNAEYWQKKAEKEGVSFIDELVGEAIGGAVPGIGTFMLDVASGTTFSFMSGYQGAEDNPFINGLVASAKTGTMHYLFKMISPLKQYLKAPTMAAVFGTEEASIAPEGEKAKAFAKGAGTGLLYSLSSPGGQMGLNEISRGIRESAAKVKVKPKVEIKEPAKEKTIDAETLKEELKSFDIEREFGTAKAITKAERDKAIDKFIDEKYGRIKDPKKVPDADPIIESAKTKSFTDKVKESVKTISKDAKTIVEDTARMADEYLGSISTRLGNINPTIKQRLRKFEFKTGVKKTETTAKVMPLFEKAKAMPEADRKAFDMARKNGDKATIDKLAKQYGMETEVEATRKVLDKLYKEAGEVGYEVQYRKDYYPRKIKDVKGYLEHMYGLKDWPVLDRAIKQQETELGRYLEAEEKAQLINSMLRGYDKGKIQLAKPGQLKERKISKVTEELDKFYMDSDSAMIQYINDLTDSIEAKKLFGAGGDIENTIGGYTAKLLAEKKIKPQDEHELKNILSARFNEVGTRGLVGLYKNVSYIDTMGSPISAITQIGDLAWPMYKTGLKQTAKALGKSIKGKSKIKKEELGIERIAAEFSDQTKSAKAVSTVFDKIGLSKIDNIGKETLINATYETLVKKTKTKKGLTELEKELKPTFEGETEQLISDLKAGKITENVKLHLFNTLADFQPIALSEMPQKYLTGGNGRIFYMLKTFTLKQFDIYRREVFQQISKSGTRVKGIKNLVKLAGVFAVANGTADVIKNIMLNRPIDPDDLVVDNMLRLFGISKFVTWKAREEGVGSATVRQVAPPFKLIDALSKDINKAGDEKGLESTASIPIVGKLYYWWFGRGKDKIKNRRKKIHN